MTVLMLAGLAQAAVAEVPMPAKTSLFFQCQVRAPDDSAMHELNVAYFSQPPAGTRGFNLRDPDAILPLSAKPKLANAWPTTVVITFEDASSSARLAATAFQPIWGSSGRATIAVDRNPPATGGATHFSGECGYSEGDAAEKQFLELTQ
jgi:hypothetical protein